MFLMNAPPVLALQSKWEGFGLPGSFRFPGCFSEADEGVESEAVSAWVQMLITTLQRDGAARRTSDELAAQRGHRAEGCHDARPAAKPPPLLHPYLAACGLVADVDPMGEEEAADFGPLVLDSDSDDSVDRDIEEAFQEYLKAKSGATQPGSGKVQPGTAQQPSRASGGGSRCKPEPAHSSAPTALGPPKPGSGGGPGSQVGSSQDQGSASPVSVSSDDSFEQGIRAEIEQFLNEKRQHETQKCDGSVDKKPGPKENSAAKLLLKSHQEPAARVVHRQGLMGTQNELTFRRPPRLAKINMQPRNLRSTVTTTQEHEGSTKPAAPCHPSEATQNQSGMKRRASAARRGGRAPSAAQAPEEAIQLYQLQKTRKEADGDPSQRAQLREERQPDPPAHSTTSATKNALPETHRKTPGKKKPVAAKTTDPGPGGLDTDHFPKLPKETKAPPPVGSASRSEFVERFLCRADTSTELMCAEAILDISKTMLPAPVKGSDGSLSASPLFHSANVPSHSDGDSSSMDSDDSIEQEIRTFLALKAQSGSLLARGESCPQVAQGPLSPPGPNGQTSGPKDPLSKTADPLLGCKRKRRGGGHVRPSVRKKTREVVKDWGRDADHSQGRAEPGHEGRDLPAPGGEGASQGKTDETWRLDEKNSEDKSSSLDSDEDLDTAIKDLLRSKRKLKKQCREPRAACRKKVRFSTKQAHFLEQLEDRRPPVLKSCLSKSKRDGSEGPAKKSPSVFGGTAETTKQEGAGSQDTPPPPPPPPAFRVRRPASASTCASASEGNPFPRESQGSAPSPGSLSDDSSSVDSDDSIELEIWKFLAEKAKESVSSSEIQAEGPAALGTGGPARPEVLGRKEPAQLPGMCTQTQRPAEGSRGTESSGAQGAAGLFGRGWKGLPAAPSRPRGSSTQEKCLRSQRPEPTRDRACCQKCFWLAAQLCHSGCRADLSHGLWEPGLPDPQPGKSAAQPVGTALRSTKWGHRDRKTLPLSKGRLLGWGGGARQAGLFSPHLGLPLQGQFFSAFREAQAGPIPVFGSPHLLMKKDGGPWPSRKVQPGLSLHDRRSSGLGDSFLDLRYRRRVINRDEQDQDALGSDASDFSDTSGEDSGGSSVVKV
uniref:Protein phosphatase 1 regulatory subunit 26 N-terminal domain-containing protein n=1 Tax=Cebus imitator TaxID=2715852 RepID=A0A2K5PSY3_CEBIM